MDRDSKTAVYRVTTLFIASRTLIALLGWLSTSVIEKAKWYGTPQNLLDYFARWDTRWYMQIAREGYTYDSGGENTIAFFPLYPLLAAGLSKLGLTHVQAGFLISNVCFFIGLLVLYRLTERETGDSSTALDAAALMAFFPGTLYHSITYSEGLFFMLAVSAFHCARRGRWLAASLLGGLLGATRNSGILIAVPILIEYIFPDGWSRKIRRPLLQPSALAFLLIPVGLAAHMTYLWIRFGDPLLFTKAQGAWGRRISFFWETFSTVVQHQMIYRWLFIGSALFLAACCVLMAVKKMRPSYVIYSSLSWLFFVSFLYLEGIMRFTSVVFPVFMVLAAACRIRRLLFSVLLAAFSMVLAIASVMIANGYWLT